MSASRFRKFQVVAVFHLLAGAACLFSLVVPSRARAEAASLRVGTWNSFLGHVNIVECVNPGDSPISAQLLVQSDRNQLLSQIPFTVSPFGTQHIDLRSSLPRDAYGTYQVLESGSSTGGSVLLCATSVYRFSSPGSNRAVDYAFNIPASAPLRGPSAGVFNSYRPDGSPGVVWNWLSIYNPSSRVLAGSVEIYRQDGSLDGASSFRLDGLQAGERRDFALGHPQGQTVGLYRFNPDSQEQDYGAFLTRYSAESESRFSFAFPTLARKPSCDPLVLPASTMDPAFNWAEIANVGPFTREVSVSVYDSLGALKSQQHYSVRPYSQQHFFLNSAIGESAVGSFQVRCDFPAADGQGLLVQSAYYGRRGSVVDWAYVSQGAPAIEPGTKLVHLFNTYLGAANWKKLLARDVRGSDGDSLTFDTSGSLARMRSAPILPNGSVDLPLHEFAGFDLYGMSVAQSGTGGASLTSDLLRVFPDNRGGLGYIMNVPAQVVPPQLPLSAAARVSPGSEVFEVGGRPQMIVGESITQGWMELGTDFKQDEFLDALAARGVNLLMIWSFIGINDQVGDSRIAYNAPRLWPWIETNSTFVPPYRFLFVTPLGEPIFNTTYFRYLRQLAKGAQQRGIMLLITIHDGWTKERFDGHPMNIVNGGQLVNKRDYVILATPGREMPQVWDEFWSAQQKHQYLLERFTEEILKHTSEFPNVMYEVLNEGEWYDPVHADAFERHFTDFISARTSRILLVNQLDNLPTNFMTHPQVSAISNHFPNWNLSTPASLSFSFYSTRVSDAATSKPFLFNEPVPPYRGSVGERTALVRLMWGTLLGGAGFVMPDDVSWRFNPEQVDLIIDRVGYAARFFNGNDGPAFWQMNPAGNLIVGGGVCLAKPGSDYVIYGQGGTSFELDLSNESGSFVARFFSPYTGEYREDSQVLAGGGIRTVNKPDANDWVVRVRRQ